VRCSGQTLAGRLSYRAGPRRRPGCGMVLPARQRPSPGIGRSDRRQAGCRWRRIFFGSLRRPRRNRYGRRAMTTVDQQKIRRSRTGLIAHDPALAQPGYTLFAPMSGDGAVYLIDMDGEVAHRWQMPHRPGLYGHLLDNGHLFYGGKIMEDLERFEAWPRFKAGAVLEADWNGRALWEVRHKDHHTDARQLKRGNVLLLCLRPLSAEI